jgi:uncharacterized membrane protein YidH (DUF202 family)
MEQFAPGMAASNGEGARAGVSVAAGASRAAALVRTRVEPKTFFANERTFLQWLQISVLVMMIAFGLLRSGPEGDCKRTGLHAAN